MQATVPIPPKDLQATSQRLMQFAMGVAPALIIDAAVQAGVFDALESGPKTVAQVAAASGASERALGAVMNALIGLELLRRNGEGYSLTPDSATFLVKTKATYYGGFFGHVRADLIPAWLHLNEVVRTGHLARDFSKEQSGGEFFEDFVTGLFAVNYPAAEALGKTLRVSDSGETIRVLDLAAGSGVWGIAMAQQSPKVRVTAIDWQRVIPVTQKTAVRFHVDDRFKFIGGDLLEVDFGGEYDVAILGHILHTLGPSEAKTLVEKTARALVPGGTLAIAERLVKDDRSGPPPNLVFAVIMLLLSENGGTYSFEEISRWLQAAGCENARLVDSPAPSPLILANKR